MSPARLRALTASQTSSTRKTKEGKEDIDSKDLLIESQLIGSNSSGRVTGYPER